MRNTFLIFLNILSSFISYGFMDCDLEKTAKNLLIGRWVLTTDKDFIIDIRSDTIIYYYGGKLDMSNSVKFMFDDSLDNYYDVKYSRFDFMRNGILMSKISIIEFDEAIKDTIFNEVVYLDKNGLDIVSRSRSVSFKRLQK